jgi:hypothetical protein
MLDSVSDLLSVTIALKRPYRSCGSLKNVQTVHLWLYRTWGWAAITFATILQNGCFVLKICGIPAKV